MAKPVKYAICEQQRRKSACASSLISIFIVCCLDSIIIIVAISDISRLLLASVAELAGLSLTWSQTSKTGFLVTWLMLSVMYQRMFWKK